MDAFHRDVVHHDFGVVLPAPFLGKRAGEPLVILGQEMRPFGDPQRRLLGQRAIRENHERPNRRRGGRQPDNIAAGGFYCSDFGHSDNLPKQFRSSNHIALTVGWANRPHSDAAVHARECGRVAHAIQPLGVTAWAKSPRENRAPWSAESGDFAHPTRLIGLTGAAPKTWMAGTSPAMTPEKWLNMTNPFVVS